MAIKYYIDGNTITNISLIYAKYDNGEVFGFDEESNGFAKDNFYSHEHQTIKQIKLEDYYKSCKKPSLEKCIYSKAFVKWYDKKTFYDEVLKEMQ